jgi:hypothetical protein
MADRRSHPRYSVLYSWDGTVQLLRDVTVVARTNRELTMICEGPTTLDEMMTLDLRGGASTASLRVRVLESKPVLVAGQMRHEVRLEVAGGVVDGVDVRFDAVRASGG